MRPNVRRVAFGDGYEQRLAFGINTQPEVWTLEFRGEPAPRRPQSMRFCVHGVPCRPLTGHRLQAPVAKFVCEEWSRSVDEPNVETVRAPSNRCLICHDSS
jgi:phage-related protein